MGAVLMGISLVIAWACIMALQADVRSPKKRVEWLEGKDVK